MIFAIYSDFIWLSCHLPILHVPFFSSASNCFISVCAHCINGGVPVRAVRCAPPGGGYGLFGAGGFYQNGAAGGLDTEPVAQGAWQPFSAAGRSRWERCLAWRKHFALRLAGLERWPIC